MPETTVAELVDRLFKTHRRPDGREYTYHEVADALGGAIDSTSLSKLRSGAITNPGRRSLLLLCQFFHVPAAYFFPELDVLAPQDTTISAEEQLHAAFRSMGVP
ncbi:MAG: helix-turn-helix domain-containing protein, partial [Chloroflexota bacterium]|nr:helix-turn-helix domain-containing protein [Chloroflexota bacterium]